MSNINIALHAPAPRKLEFKGGVYIMKPNTHIGPTWSISLAIRKYISYLSDVKQLGDNTIFHYGHDLLLFKRFIERITKQKADEIHTTYITGKVIRAFLDDQTHRRNNQLSSNRRRLACLRGFLQYLHAREAIATPLHNVHTLPPTKRNLPAILKPKETNLLLQAARTVAPNPARDYAITLLFLTCGCRLSELLNLRVDDINLKYAIIHLRGDEYTDRYLSMPLETHRALSAYLARRPVTDEHALFLNRANKPITKGAIYHTFYRCRSAAGIRRPRITVHTLRHTYIYNLVASKRYAKDEIQELTGHRSEAALNSYYAMLKRNKKKTDDDKESDHEDKS